MTRRYAMSDADRQRRSKWMKTLNAGEVSRERASKRMKALHTDPKFAKAASERMKALNADPKFRTRQIASIRRRNGGDPGNLSKTDQLAYARLRTLGLGNRVAMRTILHADTATPPPAGSRGQEIDAE